MEKLLGIKFSKEKRLQLEQTIDSELQEVSRRLGKLYEALL